MSFASLKTLRPFFTDQCGRLLAGGKVYTYEVGTLTPKATYKDAAGLTENTNPIALDTSGEADIYINSDYRFQIFDHNGVLIDDVDSIAPTQRISSAFLIDVSGLTQEQINATKENTLNKGAAGGYPSLDDAAKIPVEQIPVVNDLTTNNTAKPLSAAMGKKLQDEKFAVANLVNDLTSGGVDKALTAEQGKALFAMFANSLLPSGYQKIPNPLNPSEPLIMQWGGNSVNKGAVLDVTLPIAYPNSHLRAFGILQSDGLVFSGSYSICAAPQSNTTIRLSNSSASTSLASVSWFSLGK